MEVVQQFQVSGVTKPLWAASCPGQEVLSKADRTALAPVLGHTTCAIQPAMVHSGPGSQLGAGGGDSGRVRPAFASRELSGYRVVGGAGTEGSMGAVEPGRFASPWGPWGLGCVGPVRHSTSRTLGVAWDAVGAQ